MAMTSADFPALYRAASLASGSIQRRFYLALGSALAIFIASAALSLLELRSPVVALAQVGLLFVSLVFSIYLATAKPQKLWYGARALAESVKTLTWRYMMRGEPFDLPDREARAHFVATLRKTLVDNREVSAHAVEMSTAEQITGGMEACRASPLSERKSIYVEQRINHQQSWYHGKAGANHRAARRWFVLLILANCLAILSALGRVRDPDFAYWPTDLFAAAAAAALGWMQGKKYQELAASYTLTAHEIGLVRAELPDDEDEARFSQFVADAENVFSREHIQWQARRDAE